MSMTLEELKKEADRLGYALVKKTDTSKRLKPCPGCGDTGRPKYTYDEDAHSMVCRKCGYTVSIPFCDVKRFTVKSETILKLMRNGDWDPEKYTRPGYKPGGRYRRIGRYTVAQLHDGRLDLLPEEGGVYRLRMYDDFVIEVLDKNVGRQTTSKGKPSEYVPEKLRKKVAKVYGTEKPYRTDVIYIGQTNCKGGLRERIREYLGFRYDEKTRAHDGGRAAWQIKNSENLIVEYVVIDDGRNPEDVEKEMLREFKEKYGDYPLANRRL